MDPLGKRLPQEVSDKQYKRTRLDEEEPLYLKAMKVIAPALKWLTQIKWIPEDQAKVFIGRIYLVKDDVGVTSLCTEILYRLFHSRANFSPVTLSRFPVVMEAAYNARVIVWNKHIAYLDHNPAQKLYACPEHPYFLFNTIVIDQPLGLLEILMLIVNFVNQHGSVLEVEQKTALKTFLIKRCTTWIRFSSLPIIDDRLRNFALVLEKLEYLPESFFKEIILSSFSSELSNLQLVTKDKYLSLLNYLSNLVECCISWSWIVPPLTPDARARLYQIFEDPSAEITVLQKCEQLIPKLDSAYVAPKKLTFTCANGVVRELKSSEYMLLKNKCERFSIYETAEPLWKEAKERTADVKEFTLEEVNFFIRYLTDPETVNRENPVPSQNQRFFKYGAIISLEQWSVLFRLGNFFILKSFEPVFDALERLSLNVSQNTEDLRVFLTVVSDLITQFPLPHYEKLWIEKRNKLLFPLGCAQLVDIIVEFEKAKANLADWERMHTVEICSFDIKFLENLAKLTGIHTLIDNASSYKKGERKKIFERFPNLKKFVTPFDCTTQEFVPSAHLEVLHLRIKDYNGKYVLDSVAQFIALFPSLKELRIKGKPPSKFRYTSTDQKKAPHLRVYIKDEEIKPT